MKQTLILLVPILAALGFASSARAGADDIFIRQRNTADTAFAPDRILPADQVVDTWAKFREEAGITDELALKRSHINTDAAITVTEGSPDTATLTWTGGKVRTLTLIGDTTLSYTAPSAGDEVRLEIIGHSAAVTLTLATATYSECLGANRTTWPIPANAYFSVNIRYDGTIYQSIGDPIQKTKFIGSPQSPDTSGGTVTVSDTIDGVTIYTNTATAYNLEDAANCEGKVVALYNMGTNTPNLNPDNADVIYLTGAALSAGDSIAVQNVAGSFVALQARSGAWVVWGRNGTVTDAN